MTRRTYKCSRLGRARQRGTSFIEVLVAACVFASCLSAMVGMWYFSYGITSKTIDRAVAYNLERQKMETIKQTGFYNTPEYLSASPDVHYYDGNATNLDNTPTSARFKVTTTVVSDLIVTGSSPVAPADNALRTVTITVTLVNGGTTLCQAKSYLARAGI
jgi:Tfp pilus assembly protein PilV